MGEVYRARDRKLGRDVAIKVLPDVFALDVERLSRFEREAKLLAALNHPSIASIYDFQKAEQTPFLVMELVEGETLAERIARGGLPIEECLSIFEQIARGLEFAHEQGIIHRDLKPANIKVTEQGATKILDFGLAKAMAEEWGASGDPSESPTLVSSVTGEGMIAGTLGYMSPEQARGRPIDKRADIWAFGSCLYESLTGRRAFKGETASDLLADILKTEPDWDALPADTPARVRVLLWRCLQKDPQRRLRDIGDALLELDETSTDPSGTFPALGPTVPVSGISRARLLATALSALLIGLVVAALATWTATRLKPGPLKRFEISLAPEAPISSDGFLAFSRDGRHLAYVSEVDGGTRIYVKRLGEAEFRPLAATEGGEDPFFSPDGEWIGFDDLRGDLKAVRFTGGPAREIWTGGQDLGRGIWGEDDTITISARVNGKAGLYRIAAAGGKARLFAAADTQDHERIIRRPGLLPGGKGILAAIAVNAPQDEWPIAVFSLETGEPKRLGITGIYPRYAPTGHVIFFRGDNLWAVPFDLARLELAGTPVPVVEGVAGGYFGRAAFAFSTDGTLIYLPGRGVSGAARLVSVDREGHAEPLPVEEGDFVFPRLSPDGLRLAVTIGAQGASQVHIHELGSGRPPVPVTFGDIEYAIPVWSPDGGQLAVAGSAALYLIPTDLSRHEPRLLFESTFGAAPIPCSFSPDGDELIFNQQSAEKQWDIMGISLEENSEPRVLVANSADNAQGRVSPDGRWLAYATDLSGRFEIRVRPYPEPMAAPPAILSVAGGEDPIWKADGQELYYLENRSMMAVTAPTADDPDWGDPRKLFDFESGLLGPLRFQQYDAAPDGSRFITVMRSGFDDDESETAETRLVVLQNWFEELKRLAPRDR